MDDSIQKLNQKLNCESRLHEKSNGVDFDSAMDQPKIKWFQLWHGDVAVHPEGSTSSAWQHQGCPRHHVLWGVRVAGGRSGLATKAWGC